MKLQYADRSHKNAAPSPKLRRRCVTRQNVGPVPRRRMNQGERRGHHHKYQKRRERRRRNSARATINSACFGKLYLRRCRRQTLRRSRKQTRHQQHRCSSETQGRCHRPALCLMTDMLLLGLRRDLPAEVSAPRTYRSMAPTAGVKPCLCRLVSAGAGMAQPDSRRVLNHRSTLVLDQPSPKN